jgi:hypothetical protein
LKRNQNSIRCAISRAKEKNDDIIRSDKTKTQGKKNLKILQDISRFSSDPKENPLHTYTEEKEENLIS